MHGQTTGMPMKLSLPSLSRLTQFARKDKESIPPSMPTPTTTPPTAHFTHVSVRLPHIPMQQTKNYLINRENTPRPEPDPEPEPQETEPQETEPTWSSGPLSSAELEVFSDAKTARIEAIPTAPVATIQRHPPLPTRRDETTGLDFVRIFLRESDNFLDGLESIIHKQLRKQKDPSIIYMHSQDYQILCQQYFEVYQTYMHPGYITTGLYRRPIQVMIYLADQMHIDLPRGVLICQ